MIEKFYTTTFKVYRDEWKEDENGKYTERSLIGTYNGHLQQATPELAQQLGLKFTNTFTLWCGVLTDIQESDEVWVGSTKYAVSAIQKNLVGINQHLEVILQL